MDSTIFVAAKEGNIERLLQLLREDPLILERITTNSADTPLHIAAMLGHLEFVKELIKSKTNAVEYVQELNQHGFSAIHMASANGHKEIVEELLKFRNELCNLKGKNGMTPLHCACLKGRFETIGHLLSVSRTATISELTVRGETALHLAVKNNQFQALATLVEWLRLNNQLQIVNLKDEEGNTVLHLAAARRNRQMLELLLKCNITKPGTLQVNAKNQSHLTALDLVLLFPCETSYGDIEMVLKYAGAESSSASFQQSENRVGTQFEQPLNDSMTSLRSRERRNLSREEVLDWSDYFKFKSDVSNPEQVRSDLLVVTVLLATATYQAVLSPPGGVSDEKQNKGQSLLAFRSTFSFIWFMFFNTAGFFMSLATIMTLNYNYPLFWELYVAIFAMAVTYDSAMATLSPPGPIRQSFILLAIIMPISIPLLSYRIRKWCKTRRGGGPLA